MTPSLSCLEHLHRGLQSRLAKIAALLAISFSAISAAANGIRLNAEDINSRDEVLFSVCYSSRQTASVPSSSYNALFMAELKNPACPLSPITCYPERMELLSDGRFQVRSKYGTAIYDTNTSRLRCCPVSDIPLVEMRLCAVSQSPNGKWLCFVRRNNATLETSLRDTVWGCLDGSLVLQDTTTGKKYVLDNKAAFAYEDIPVKWSPDGTIFVYSKGEKVYFCDTEAIALDVQIDEKYRTIGNGTIESVCWASDKGETNLFYIDADVINKIPQNGLYTQSLYADILGRGKPCGRLPYKFDPEHDTFSARGDGSSVAVLKGGALLSVYNTAEGAALLQATGTAQVADASAPLVASKILWGANGAPLVWSQVMPWNGSETAVVLQAGGAGERSTVLMKEEGLFHPPIVSPNGRRVAFFNDKSLRVCDADTWRVTGEYTAERIVSAVWDGNYAMYLGGESTVSRWIVGDAMAEPLFPSSAAAHGGTAQDGVISVVCPNGEVFTAASEQFSKRHEIHWQKAAASTKRSAQETVPLNNGRYRIFSAASPNPQFENALYVRDLHGKGSTWPLFASCGKKQDAKRRIALVLDAYGNAEHLPQVLHFLSASKVKATFFINGAFVQRYPDQTRCIARSGIACASMFFTDADLAGGSFVSDDEFIARGLGRMEDVFLRAAGQELLPLWHAPRYKANSKIRRAGEDAGYTYIDAISEDTASAPTLDAMLRALEMGHANALAVKIGSPLSKRLDVIVGALLEAGYEIAGAEEL